MIPSLNGIEISVKGATSVLLGVKGLNDTKLIIFVSNNQVIQNLNKRILRLYMQRTLRCTSILREMK